MCCHFAVSLMPPSVDYYNYNFYSFVMFMSEVVCRSSGS
jgi:hypothetical protein